MLTNFGTFTTTREASHYYVAAVLTTDPAEAARLERRAAKREADARSRRNGRYTEGREA